VQLSSRLVNDVSGYNISSGHQHQMVTRSVKCSLGKLSKSSHGAIQFPGSLVPKIVTFHAGALQSVGTAIAGDGRESTCLTMPERWAGKWVSDNARKVGV